MVLALLRVAVEAAVRIMGKVRAVNMACVFSSSGNGSGSGSGSRIGCEVECSVSDLSHRFARLLYISTSEAVAMSITDGELDTQMTDPTPFAGCAPPESVRAFPGT
jgi:hypothetical protein